jgi:hypothetical protein
VDYLRRVCRFRLERREGQQAGVESTNRSVTILAGETPGSMPLVNFVAEAVVGEWIPEIPAHAQTFSR